MPLQLMDNRDMRMYFLAFLIGLLTSCTSRNDLLFNFTNPLDSCEFNNDTDQINSVLIDDKINQVFFRIGSEWKVTFNDNLQTTECIDTVSFDKFRRVRTFIIHSIKSSSSIDDYFQKEFKAMKNDSVFIHSIGTYKIDGKEAIYVVETTRMKNIGSIDNVLFYLKEGTKILTMHIGVSSSKKTAQGLCSSLSIVKSISFKPNQINSGSASK